MLNPFPIQFLALFAYLILRVFVGALFIYFGFVHLKHRKEIAQVMKAPWQNLYAPFAVFSAGIEMLIGVLFVIGLFTQIAALGAILISLKVIFFRSFMPSPYVASRAFYILLFGCACSLLITGAGVIAFDLPI